MPEGVVKFFNEEKGFGFITPSKGGKDVFFHVTGLVDKVQDKDDVAYEEKSSPRGPYAVNIVLI